MAMRGVQRATLDLDFILMLEDLEQADRILRDAGFRRAFHSENVSHYVGDEAALGRIDLLHAFRGPSLGMLVRAERLEVADGLTLPVVQIEDIIGLKVQAAVNDPRREASDWSDIRLLIEIAAQTGKPLDWELLADYLELFELTCELPMLRHWYGQTD
jgi:predicted nucleotidyltransferase